MNEMTDATTPFDDFRQLLVVLLVLSLVSATSLGYQTIQWLMTGECGCNPAFTRYGVIFGIPVSFIGFIGMITFATFTILFLLNKPIFNLDLMFLFKIFFLLVTIGLAFVIYLMYISYVVVEDLCQLCLISQTITILIWLISFRIFHASFLSKSRRDHVQ